MSANSFDRVLSSAALNKTAAVVTGRGEHWEPKIKVNNLHLQAPPKMKSVPGDAGFVDLTGVKFGRFTVLGLMASDGGRWVVRCACGSYETRRRKAITNQNNKWDRCVECRQLGYIRRAEYFQRTGKDKPIEEFYEP